MKAGEQEMKILISFICGIIISCVAVFCLKPVLPTFAETSDPGAESSGNTQGIVDSISSLDKIYRDALTEPFIKAESKIYDEDIADYYHGLMEKTGLTDPSQ
jgi:hypothetical protein